MKNGTRKYVWLAKGRRHECTITNDARHMVGVTPEGRGYEGDTPEEIMDSIAGVFIVPRVLEAVA